MFVRMKVIYRLLRLNSLECHCLQFLQLLNECLNLASSLELNLTPSSFCFGLESSAGVTNEHCCFHLYSPLYDDSWISWSELMIYWEFYLHFELSEALCAGFDQTIL